MDTENRAVIAAPRDLIFDLAAHVERWPDLLPHYRHVDLLAGGERWRVVHMAAQRDGFPVSWTSIQEIDPDAFTIRFRHIRGLTRGMWVEWRFEERDGVVHITIRHHFERRWPVVGPLFARFVVGELFVRNIARKTLRHLKAHAERISGTAEVAR